VPFRFKQIYLYTHTHTHAHTHIHIYTHINCSFEPSIDQRILKM